MKKTTSSTTKSKKLDPSEFVYASAVVKSKGGKSMFDKGVQITLAKRADALQAQAITSESPETKRIRRR